MGSLPPPDPTGYTSDPRWCSTSRATSSFSGSTGSHPHFHHCLPTRMRATWWPPQTHQSQGPFSMVTPRAAVRHRGGGDFTIFVDRNNQGYIAYDAWSNSHKISIEKLTPDLLDSTGNGTSDLSPSNNEAPMVFERAGWYYLLWGPTCCFCHQGSGAVVSVSKAGPLGPWTTTSLDINPKQGWLGLGGRTIKAQNNYVFQANTTSGIEYIYTCLLYTSPSPRDS
eukprot:TRINITY_DN8267_c0_g1_i1.p1 TRINITY_DN8267_c0_g1~~TRINITY_DN8267_c0_g1_i1.p1  ORF type:complete len:224 (+),score=16.93 TRINITY_DN8267_c0_g1_i1:386-1057(+)